jgi:CubicO group peptidase (beta-lactamase class C family)
MKKIKFLSAIVLLTTIFACNNQNSSEQPDFSHLSNVKLKKDQPFKEFLEKVRQYYKLPAIAAAVITSDSVLHLDVVGINNTIDNLKIDDTALFNIGSCAKSLTSLLVAKLIEQGYLDWDTKLLEVINLDKEVIDKTYNKISVIDLLSHSSGYHQYSSDEDFFSISNKIPELSGNIIKKRNQFVIWNCMNAKPLEIGEFHYSNGGYVAVASMLESVTEKTWEVLIDDEILKPLELHSAKIGFAQEFDTNQPWRHFGRDSKGYGIPLPSEQREIPDLFNPAGNISMSIGDFAKYAQFHLQCLFESNETFIDSDLVKKLHEPTVNNSESESYGLGWSVSFFKGEKVSAHSGGDQSTYAIIVIDHSLRKAWVIMTNIGDSNAEIACGNIIMETQ